MENNTQRQKYALIIVVVNCGLGSRVLKTAKSLGVTGGTILFGKGTVKNHLLELLGFNDIKREIVLMVTGEETANSALEGLNERFHLKKPNTGIAFSVPVMRFLGSRDCDDNNVYTGRGVKNIMYNAIFTVVDRGRSEAVIDAAYEAGARGATVINARGSGIDEKSVLFSIVVEPEKEMVMILSERGLTDTIVSSIREAMEIDQPGKGIMFVLDVDKTFGLYPGEDH